MIENLNDGVLVLDPSGQVHTANPAALQLLASAGNKLHTPFALHQQPAWEPLWAMVQATFASAQPQRADVALLHPGQSPTGLRVRSWLTAARDGGRNDNFIEDPRFEQPLNVYGYSKQLFDQYVRRWMPEINSQVVGLKYFNVYGPREQHKGSMASVAFHLNTQVKQGDNPKLFEGCDGFPDGGQMRDFIYVDDVCKVNLWFWQNPQHSGIFNCGTGRAEPFQNVAEAVIRHHQKGAIEYIPFPDHLKGRYQSFTQADLTKLRGVGYDGEFKTVAEGVADYMAWLNRA